MAKNAFKYLIIGNSAGGIGAVEAIRSVDKQGAISIVSDEAYPAYSRPMISHYLADKCPIEKMLFRPADFYDKNKISTFFGKKADQLDVEKHTVRLDSGEKLSWEKLLLATGGVPIVPKMEGVARDGVFSFTTLDDAKKIDEYLKGISLKKARAVVIGGGLIGVSVTEALVKRGIKVTIIEMKDRILNVILDEAASAIEAAKLKEAGVTIVTDHTVSDITSYVDGAVTGVTLDGGKAIACSLVIVAIGVRPRLDLVAGTGIKTNRGIVVDRHMASSQTDVYACGDVAEAYDFTYGECRLTPIWPNAYLGGRVAGLNMAGIKAEYPGGTAMNSMKYFGVDVVSAGIVNPPDASYELVSNKFDGGYRKVVLKDGIVAGLVFAGQIDKSGIVFGLMKERINVRGFEKALVAKDFGLASLPEEIWRSRLGLTPSSPVESAKVAVRS